MAEITLSQAIRKIEEELINSQLEREKQNLPPLFTLQSVELEMQVAIKSTTSSKGGVDIKLLSVQFGDDIAKEKTHKVKLILDVNKGSGVEQLPGVFPDKK